MPTYFFQHYRGLDQRYEVAVETRNNLVAASQNIQGAQRYLSNVQFPYCAPPEVDTLNKVTYFYQPRVIYKPWIPSMTFLLQGNAVFLWRFTLE